MTNEFKEKFQIDKMKVLEFKHWVVSVRPQQPTVGSLVLSLKRTSAHFGDLKPEETKGLSEVFSKIENMLLHAFEYEKINYLALMMIDEQVHYHVIPRYSSVKEIAGFSVVDKGWPGPPNLSDASDDAKLLNEIVETLKNINNRL